MHFMWKRLSHSSVWLFLNWLFSKLYHSITARSLSGLVSQIRWPLKDFICLMHKTSSRFISHPSMTGRKTSNNHLKKIPKECFGHLLYKHVQLHSPYVLQKTFSKGCGWCPIPRDRQLRMSVLISASSTAAVSKPYMMLTCSRLCWLRVFIKFLIKLLVGLYP